jgi:phosphoglycolate phosphatase-like HAD superfamily hydrolase
MFRERGPLEIDPIRWEKRAQLREWVGKKNINLVLFDFDDTLIKTAEIFVAKMGEFVSIVSDSCGLSSEEVHEALVRLNNSLYAVHSVDPTRWDAVVEKMCETYAGHDREVFWEARKKLNEIYRVVPRVNEGALELLQDVKGIGIKTGLVTHAGEEWTNFKLEALNMGHFFDRIKMVPVREFKNKIHWEEAILGFGIDPHEVLVLGDNLAGDIEAAKQVGVKRLIWIPSPWSVYRGDGNTPDGVVKVDRIDQAMDAILAME